MMKNKTIFEYSDFQNPFLKVTVFDANGEQNELLIKFSEYELENGTIIDTDSVVARINETFDKIFPVELLLSCEEIYKSVLSLPKMNRFRAEATYRKQMKDMQRDEYTVIADSYTHSVGCVFNSYFVPNRIVNCLKKIAKDLNARVENVRLFGMFLKEQLNFKQDYVYFYVRENLCRMILVVENRLVTEYDFCFESAQDIKRQFLMVASKHEFEFERKKISFYGVDSDIPLELNLGLKRIDIDEEEYSTEGIEIEYDDDPSEQMTNTKPTTFEERLESCPEYVRKRYEKLSEQICQYADMKCQLSDVCATFFVKSKVWFKIDIDQKGEGKRISLYIAEDPQKFVKRKIQFAISKKQNFLNTPCLLRISTNSRFVLAKQTIKKCMEDNNVVLGKKTETAKEKKPKTKFGKKPEPAKDNSVEETNIQPKFSFGKKPEPTNDNNAKDKNNNQQHSNKNKKTEQSKYKKSKYKK